MFLSDTSLKSFAFQITEILTILHQLNQCYGPITPCKVVVEDSGSVAVLICKLLKFIKVVKLAYFDLYLDYYTNNDNQDFNQYPREMRR